MKAEEILSQSSSGALLPTAANTPMTGDVASAPTVPRAARWLVRFVVPVALLCVAYGLQTIARAHPQAVEHYYSRALYPRIGRALSFTNRYVGFSVGEALLLAALVGLLLLFALQARRLYLRRARIGSLALTGFSCLLWLAGVMSLLFLLLWGLNFQRPSLAENTGLGRMTASEEQLLTISRALIAGINRSYTEASAGARIAAPPDRAELYAIIEEAYRREPLLQGIGGAGGYGPPKPVYFSGLMSRLGIAGRYFPFTGEPEYNAAQPAFDLPHAIAHEMAHQRGFAREDEANFIAFLVCINSSHPFVRYSGYLNALNAADALAAAAAPPERSRAIFAALAAGPRADLRARAAFWAQFRGRIRAVSYQVNDTYLRANDVAAGVGNYNEDVALIISYYLTRPPQTPLNE